MKNVLKITGVLVLTFVGYIAYMLINPVSPKETVNYSTDFSDFEVVYSRPYMNNRLIFGEESEDALVPYGKYWRTGANAATTFETSNGISFNGQKLDPGKYRLYTVPGKNEWKVVLNSEGDKFFAISEPDYSKDILTTSVKPEIKPKNIVEQFTIRFAKSEKGTEMNLVWDTTVLTIPIG